MEEAELEGFIVHVQKSISDGRIFLCGRLSDGRSFALADSRWRQSIALSEQDMTRALSLLQERGIREGSSFEVGINREENMEGLACRRLTFTSADLKRSVEELQRAGIACSEADIKARDAYLLDIGTKGGIGISGPWRPGKRVDLVFADPQLTSLELRPRLVWLALDLETDRAGEIRAASLAWGGLPSQAEVFLLSKGGGKAPTLNEALNEGQSETNACAIFHCSTEAELLKHFSRRIIDLDPDVITGWNIIEFDFRILARRFQALGLAFDMGRSMEECRYLEGRDAASSAVIIPGRQCLDALRILRSSGEHYEDMKLDTVAQAVLGEGKSVSLEGEEKLAELDHQYLHSPEEFARYCARDSQLVLGILEKTGLKELSQMRSALTGVSLDRAWTSIPAFERLYAAGLRRRGICAPPLPEIEDYGSPGGLILDPQPGLFKNVLVLDFKSLYPSLIRTFNIDPLAQRRAGAKDDIRAPNGARFSREGGILPEAIADYFSRREEARGRGDDIAVYVYKILMNSFYGVLGARGCRYARSALAGAVTSFGQKYLQWTKAWMEGRGLRVLYGDTDSVFVHLEGHADPAGLGKNLVTELNAELAAAILHEYGLPSYMEIKLEKLYDGFYLPRMRLAHGDDEIRGRAKGYAGRIALSKELEIKGMEAVRSDWTPLARDFQIRLLSILFEDASAEKISSIVRQEAKAIYAGERDDQLIFRRHLRRSPQDYLKNEPPAVKAARMLGWTTTRGRVDYLITLDGAQPLSMRSSPIDYDYYVEKQLLPMVRTIQETIGLQIVPAGPGSEQLELGF